ncbi:MAG: hypothetical protein P4L87_23530 [Formivibrio sp.]|nr:hypothetical protein [Formivibrio sp.]
MAPDLPALIAQEKNLGFPVKWAKDGDCLVFLAPLEIDGITIQGLQLRGKTKAFYANRNITIQLQYQGILGKAEPIARICWKPFHTHNNKGKGPHGLRFVEQKGSHHHSFGDNWNTTTNQMFKPNLPIAVPLSPEPQGFFELLALVRKEFRIMDADAIEIPQWSEKLA